MGKRGPKGRLWTFPGAPRQLCLRRQQQHQWQQHQWQQQQRQQQQRQQQQRQQQHGQRRRFGRRGRRPGQGAGRTALGLAGLPENVLAGKSKIYSPRSSKRCSGMRSPLQGDASGVYPGVGCRGRPRMRSYGKRGEKRMPRRKPSTLESETPRGRERGRPPRLPKPQSQAVESPQTPTSSCHSRGAAVTKQGPKKPMKRKRAPRCESQGKPQQNGKLPDSYPVRRSSRKSKAALQSEQRRRIDELIQSGKEEGMKIGLIAGKGRGVISTKRFSRGEFIVEYHGDLIEITDAKKREALYAQDPSTGCYMYYFQYLSKTYCIDATRETDRLGRLINHSKRGNCQTKLHDIAGIPHLILIASRDIQAGEELLYDYGDRSRESLEAHPWLKH
ncbi:N-lysine methyltransferase KMT5A-like [Sorex araneus]|uniref:N-lysine methyltransferase KMT5A-like n=1 Tax=Sorex araneus TaxID=42254 RepID=UPI0024334068|nr:N-lysine methyltransferase KMT5A-like [Sorex araneus]